MNNTVKHNFQINIITGLSYIYTSVFLIPSIMWSNVHMIVKLIMPYRQRYYCGQGGK